MSVASSGPLVAFLVAFLDGGGQLYLASGGDSETLSGDGWRYSGGTGTNGRSATENERCTNAIAAVGILDPSKVCTP